MSCRYKMFVSVFIASVVNSAFGEGLEYDAQLSTLRPRYRRIESGLPGNVEKDRLLQSLVAEKDSNWTFAWFAYGEPGSRSVSIGLANGRLYLDRNRDGQFHANERVETRVNSVWKADVDSEFFSEDNAYEHYTRTLLVRQVAEQFEIATAGGMIGTAKFGGESVMATRIDGDANGLWFDSPDRILLDKNNDGRLNPLSERIACEAVCRIANKRYAIQSDPHGNRLELVEFSGAGTLRPRVGLVKAAKVKRMNGTIVSRLGVHVPIRSVGVPVECPVGEYRLQDLALEVEDGERVFLFRFATLRGEDYPIAIQRDRTTEMDLIGKLQLTANCVRQEDESETQLTFTPMLKTEHGCCVIGSMYGSQSPTSESRLLVELFGNKNVIDRTTTGFS